MSSFAFFFLSLCSPLWAFILYLCYLPRKIPNIKDVILVSIIIALLGIYFFPWGDNQTHFAVYYFDVVERYYSNNIFSTLFLYDYIIGLVADLMGQYVWGYFFWLFVPFCILFILLWQDILRQKNKDYYLLFWIIILFVGIREYLDLNRNLVAIVTLEVALLFYFRSKIVSVILLIISLMLHTTILYLFFGGILIYFIFPLCTKRKCIVISISAFIFSMFSIPIIRLFANERIIELYLGEVWGTGTGVPSTLFYIYAMINVAIFFACYAVIIKNINQLKGIGNRLLLSIYFFSSLLTLFTYFLWTMRERFMMASILLGFVVIIKSWNVLGNRGILGRKNFARIVIAFFLCRIFIVFVTEYSSEFIHKTGSIYPIESLSIAGNILYQPTINLVDIENYGYSDAKYLRLFERVQESAE